MLCIQAHTVPSSLVPSAKLNLSKSLLARLIPSIQSASNLLETDFRISQQSVLSRTYVGLREIEELTLCPLCDPVNLLSRSIIIESHESML